MPIITCMNSCIKILFIHEAILYMHLHGFVILPCLIYNSSYGNSLVGKLNGHKSCVVPYSDGNLNVCVRVTCFKLISCQHFTLYKCAKGSSITLIISLESLQAKFTLLVPNIVVEFKNSFS